MDTNLVSNPLTKDNLYVNTYETATGELEEKIQMKLSGTKLSGTLSALVDNNLYATKSIINIAVTDGSGKTKQGLIHFFSHPQKLLIKLLTIKMDVKVVDIDVSNWDLKQKEAQLFNCNDDGKDMNEIISRLKEILKKSPGYQSYSYEILHKLITMDRREFERYDFTKPLNEPMFEPQDPKQHGGVILMF